MSDLRETLARRFHQAVESGPFGHGNPWESETGIGQSTYLRMADECIRQMRWVAFQTAHSYRSSEGYDDKDDALSDSAGYVTAAPDDWSPPK